MLKSKGQKAAKKQGYIVDFKCIVLVRGYYIDFNCFSIKDSVGGFAP
jgi:hypothetical protein